MISVGICEPSDWGVFLFKRGDAMPKLQRSEYCAILEQLEHSMRRQTQTQPNDRKRGNFTCLKNGYIAAHPSDPSVSANISIPYGFQNVSCGPFAEVRTESSELSPRRTICKRAIVPVEKVYQCSMCKGKDIQCRCSTTNQLTCPFPI